MFIDKNTSKEQAYRAKYSNDIQKIKERHFIISLQKVTIVIIIRQKDILSLFFHILYYVILHLTTIMLQAEVLLSMCPLTVITKFFLRNKIHTTYFTLIRSRNLGWHGFICFNILFITLISCWCVRYCEKRLIMTV